MDVETPRQLLRRLALAWGEGQAKHYIAQLEEVFEAAQVVVHDKKFDEIEGSELLKEKLKAVGEFSSDSFDT